jgi:predicted nucleic acid-binding protein
LRQLSAKLLLQSGEVSALALALEHGAGLFLSDDTAARVAAETLGLKVHGTLGIVVRAIRRGTRTRNQVRELLESIPEQTTLHLSRSLLSRVLISLP